MLYLPLPLWTMNLMGFMNYTSNFWGSFKQPNNVGGKAKQ